MALNNLKHKHDCVLLLSWYVAYIPSWSLYRWRQFHVITRLESLGGSTARGVLAVSLATMETNYLGLIVTAYFQSFNWGFVFTKTV